MSNFYMYFKENMDALGLPAPEGLFGSHNAAVGNAAVLMSQIDKPGRGVTMREIAVAGTRLEGLGVIGACSAAFYVGAIIGSIAVATGRCASGGTALADVLFAAKKHDLDRDWLASVVQHWPAFRNYYADKARPSGFMW
jgi:hypothetical protein